METPIYVQMRKTFPFKEYSVQLADLYASLFQILKDVSSRLDRLQCNFLWGGDKNEKKVSLGQMSNDL